jgi:hypothetical protein
LPIFSNLPSTVTLPFYFMADDGSSTHVWNVGLPQRDYTALHPRRLSSSQSPPWEPEILQSVNCRSRFYPVSIIPPCSYMIWGWTIGSLLAAVQRQPHTSDVIMNNFEQQTYYLLMRTACCTNLNHFPYIILTIFSLMARLAASKLNVGLNDSSSIPSRASIASEASQWAQWVPAGLTTLLHVFQTSRISGASPPCPYTKGEYRSSKLRRCGSSLAKPEKLSVRIRRKLLKSIFGIRSCMYRYL